MADRKFDASVGESNMRILIVDDEENIRESLKRYLEFEGLEATCVGNGLSAKRILSEEAFTAGIIDLKIPGMGGLELSRWIRDEGPGIPESEMEKVLEPFVRLEDSRNRDTGGTGLGLSIARNIVRAHGGELTLRNRPEGGLEVILMLPVPKT